MSEFYQGFCCGVAALALTSMAVFALIVCCAVPGPAETEDRASGKPAPNPQVTYDEGRIGSEGEAGVARGEQGDGNPSRLHALH